MWCVFLKACLCVFCICLSFSSIPFVLPYFTKCRLYYTFSNKTHCCTPLQLLISILFLKKAHCIVCAHLLLQLSFVHLAQQSEKFVIKGFFSYFGKKFVFYKFITNMTPILFHKNCTFFSSQFNPKKNLCYHMASIW